MISQLIIVYKMTTTYRLNNQNLKNAFDLLDYRQEGELDIPAIMENLKKMGYDKSHPELFDLINSLGNDKLNYSDYVTTLSDIMNQKDEDAGLQRMYDLLIYNPKIQFIDYETLKKISQETGHSLTDMEIQFALNEIGDGKTIPIESFIKFMKSN